MVHHLADFAFALEALKQGGIAFHLRMGNLDGDLFSVVEVGGAENRRHATAGHDVFNPVMI